MSNGEQVDPKVVAADRELALLARKHAANEPRPVVYPPFDPPTSVYKRFSPTRCRWPEIQGLDRRIAELEQRRVTISDELHALQERHRASLAADQRALADWFADGSGERPEATASALEARLEELTANLLALPLAVEKVLDEKASFVEKHRSRLTKDAAKAKSAAIARVQQLVDELEQAREEAAGMRQAELWAKLFPRAEAGGSLDHQYIKCGRKARALPELTARAGIAALFDLLREDAAFLEQVADGEQRAILEDRDPRGDPDTTWAESPEGAKVQARQSREAQEKIKAAQWSGSRWEE